MIRLSIEFPTIEAAADALRKLGAVTTTAEPVEIAPSAEAPAARRPVGRPRKDAAPAPAPVVEAAPAPAPTVAKVTVDDAKTALSAAYDKAGHHKAMSILKRFGVDRLGALKPEHLPMFVEKCGRVAAGTLDPDSAEF